MVEFAGPPAPHEDGVRFRLAGKGTLTVNSFSIADGKVVCHGTNVGNLSFPIAALSEIVFQPRNQPVPAAANAKEGGNGSGENEGPGVIFQGGGVIRGNVIINQGGVINLR